MKLVNRVVTRGPCHRWEVFDRDWSKKLLQKDATLKRHAVEIEVEIGSPAHKKKGKQAVPKLVSKPPRKDQEENEKQRWCYIKQNMFLAKPSESGGEWGECLRGLASRAEDSLPGRGGTRILDKTGIFDNTSTIRTAVKRRYWRHVCRQGLKFDVESAGIHIWP